MSRRNDSYEDEQYQSRNIQIQNSKHSSSLQKIDSTSDNKTLGVNDEVKCLEHP
jgi:hypothetical protein